MNNQEVLQSLIEEFKFSPEAVNMLNIKFTLASEENFKVFKNYSLKVDLCSSEKFATFIIQEHILFSGFSTEEVLEELIAQKKNTSEDELVTIVRGYFKTFKYLTKSQSSIPVTVDGLNRLINASDFDGIHAL